MRSINSLPITQLLLTVSCLLLVTGVESKVVVGSTRNEESNGTVSVVDIQDHNKTQYLNQNFEDGNYNYGYDIKPSGPNGQFHHENKASDGVVYGCYGYLDPNNQAQITFYISDAWGYRPVRQEQPVEVFFPAQNPEGTTDMKGDTIQWGELIFPEKCTYFAQQVAVAASNNVGQEVVGTSFGIFPATPQSSSPFTAAVNNRRPTSTAANLNPLTLPAASTPTAGISKPTGSNTQNRIPSASSRVPASTLRTPIPPSAQFTTPLNPGGSSAGSDSRPPAMNETQIEMSTVPMVFVAQNETAIHSQGFGSGGSKLQNGNENPGNSRGPTTVGSFGNSGNQGNTFGGPSTTGTVGNSGSGNGFRGPTTIGSSGNTGLGIPSASTSVSNSPFHGGVGGYNLNVEIKSPGDSIVSLQPGNGGFSSPKLEGNTTPPRNGNGGSGSGITDTSAFGNTGTGNNPTSGSSRTPSTRPSQATGFTGTDGNKRTNGFESTKTPTSSIPSNGGQDNNSPFRRPTSQSTSTKKPTEIPNGGLSSAGPLNSFYSEGSSSSIFPEGNHLSTGAPGSHPSSSNNVGETLEQEVEGTGTGIFPGRKTTNTNKLAALTTLPSGNFNPSTQPGSQRPVATTTNPNFSGAYQQATRQPTQNPTTNFQPNRNDENATGGLNPTKNQESFGFGSNSGGLRGVGGTQGPAGSTSGNGSGHNAAYTAQQPSSVEVTQGIGTSGTPTYTKSPNHFSTPAGFGGIFHNNLPLNDGTSTTCPQICSTCSANNNRQPDSEEIEYSKIPGAIIANIPVIYYPDCSANAYSRPAIVPFCPSEQQASCSNQQPLTMKFPEVPAARSASHPTGRGNRRVIRKTRHSHPANN